MIKTRFKAIDAVVAGLLTVCIVLMLGVVMSGCGDNQTDEPMEQTGVSLPEDETQAVVSASDSGNSTSDSDVQEETEVVLVEYEIELPYYIEVDKSRNVVSIYTTNSEGKYETLVRQMICSTEQVPGHFPDGMYRLSIYNDRSEWRAMISNGKALYAQYCCTISGDFLFHSVPYLEKGDHSSLSESRYLELGTSCSGGCIRLTVEGAKWIFDNCPPGTPVCIMRSGEYDEALVESLRPPAPMNGWDCTDPDPENPYYQPMYDESTEPKPYIYAPLYDYNFKWAPECTYAAQKTTTTTAEDETTTTEQTAETTTTTTAAADTAATTGGTE